MSEEKNLIGKKIFTCRTESLIGSGDMAKRELFRVTY